MKTCAAVKNRGTRFAKHINAGCWAICKQIYHFFKKIIFPFSRAWTVNDLKRMNTFPVAWTGKLLHSIFMQLIAGSNCILVFVQEVLGFGFYRSFQSSHEQSKLLCTKRTTTYIISVFPIGAPSGIFLTAMGFRNPLPTKPEGLLVVPVGTNEVACCAFHSSASSTSLSYSKMLTTYCWTVLIDLSTILIRKLIHRFQVPSCSWCFELAGDKACFMVSNATTAPGSTSSSGASIMLSKICSALQFASYIFGICKKKTLLIKLSRWAISLDFAVQCFESNSAIMSVHLYAAFLSTNFSFSLFSTTWISMLKFCSNFSSLSAVRFSTSRRRALNIAASLPNWHGNVKILDLIFFLQTRRAA